MIKISLCIIAALFICVPLFLSCTNSEDVEKTEKGAIDRMNEKAGKEMADRISGPLEKARDARDLVNKNYQDMDENLKNQ